MSSLRIVVLDEHALSRKVMCQALTARGYVCMDAETVADALAAIEMFDPDAVIYEPRMRGGGSDRLAQAFRAQPPRRGRARRVIAVSTQDEPAGFRQSHQVDAYLTKPFVADDLDALLRTLCAEASDA